MGCGVVTRRIEELGGITEGQNVMEDVSTNLSGAGVHCKITRIPKGFEVIQHKHRYAHLSVLLSGFVTVDTDYHEEVMDARDGPKSIMISADEYHRVIAHEDSVWLCIHSRESEVQH